MFIVMCILPETFELILSTLASYVFKDAGIYVLTSSLLERNSLPHNEIPRNRFTLILPVQPEAGPASPVLPATPVDFAPPFRLVPGPWTILRHTTPGACIRSFNYQ